MKIKTILSTLLLALAAQGAQAADTFVDFSQGDWLLNNNGRVTIYVSANEERGVMLAARNLQQDLKTVCGAAVEFTSDTKAATIVVGTPTTTKAFAKELKGKGKPVLILFKTEMGHGVDFMAGTHKWHGSVPSDDQCVVALSQLKETLGDF